MPRKLSENQKKIMIDNFVNGSSLEELSKKFNCTKITVSRNLKKGISEKKFKDLLKLSNKDEIKLTKKRNSELNEALKKQNSLDQSDLSESFAPTSFIEIAPFNYEFDNEPQKDLSSISISEIDFPKIVYMIVNENTELEIKLLKDYPEWDFLSKSDLNRKTIEIYNDIKVAKRFCNKEQKVIKVPNTDVFRIVAPTLISRGISRIICSEQLIAL